MGNVLVTRATGPSLHRKPVEMVERKGIGHPDTLIDDIMENISRRLSGEYLAKYGRIRHHNVDKGLICGGATEVAFGGGRFIKPIRIILSGRAFGGVAVDEIAVEATKEQLRKSLRNLDITRGVDIQSTITEIWPSWDEMSTRSSVPLSNDTSFGVGYAPLTPTERLVIDIDRHLSSRAFKTKNPWIGEDMKVMALREKDRLEFTIAAAIISKYVKNMEEYKDAKATVRQEVDALVRAKGYGNVLVNVNNADDESASSIYLTLSGTSAEMGDDGSVGRGNRANGLITPFRPMTLEAFAGKNPVNHTGKIYSFLAFEIAERIVKEFPEIENAEVYALSRIGHPINDPANISISLTTGKKYFESIKEQIRFLVEEALSTVSSLSQVLPVVQPADCR